MPSPADRPVTIAPRKPRPGAIPQPALIVGSAGAAPLVALAALAWFAPQTEMKAAAILAVINYGALLLAFLGAVHWGLAIAAYGAAKRDEVRWAGVVWSVVPAILAFVAFYPPPRIALIVLIVGHAIAALVDIWAARGGTAPNWYARLRKPLTLIAMIALGACVFVRTVPS